MGAKLFACLWEPAASTTPEKNVCTRERVQAILTQFCSHVLGHDHRLFPLSGHGVATQMLRIFPGIRCCNDRRKFMAYREMSRALYVVAPPRIPSLSPRTRNLYRGTESRWIGYRCPRPACIKRFNWDTCRRRSLSGCMYFA